MCGNKVLPPTRPQHGAGEPGDWPDIASPDSNLCLATYSTYTTNSVATKQRTTGKLASWPPECVSAGSSAYRENFLTSLSHTRSIIFYPAFPVASRLAILLQNTRLLYTRLANIL
ncbi:hypothetical protein RRG08_003914 [Elysia crispata]|uniref:Uncharacterized protein n=1 Tax=Elysia crispata TaxID=231223 RepID=A0AAE1D481_9GAST|nr:hypothetical protein RRG08_003914 [Elysia crispata]